jgi:spore maturation protein SpmB
VVLNYIWISFFLIALVVGLVRLIFLGDTAVFTNMVTSTFDTAKTGFEISLGLTGVLTLWLGLMKVGEMGGAIAALATIARPFFRRLFPEVPADHPAHGSIIMNFAANMLGLDNAATPLVIAATLLYFSGLPQERVATISTLVANVTLFGIISGFILMAALRRVNVYESFIEGAKDGFNVAVRIIPYLIAILVAIGVFRASGALDALVGGVGRLFTALGLRTDFIPALPTAIMKPLSGSGARGMMVDAMNTYGADSFVGRLASVFQGATDTTFYIIALYFGSVGVRKTRHAVACGLIADAAGIIAAIFIAYIFFG